MDHCEFGDRFAGGFFGGSDQEVAIERP